MSRKWFVPIDMMLVRRVADSTEVGIGAAYPVVRDNPSYKHNLYGRLTFCF